MKRQTKTEKDGNGENLNDHKTSWSCKIERKKKNLWNETKITLTKRFQQRLIIKKISEYFTPIIFMLVKKKIDIEIVCYILRNYVHFFFQF